jgi:hypothetical protein
MFVSEPHLDDPRANASDAVAKAQAILDDITARLDRLEAAPAKAKYIIERAQ